MPIVTVRYRYLHPQGFFTLVVIFGALVLNRLAFNEREPVEVDSIMTTTIRLMRDLKP